MKILILDDERPALMLLYDMLKKICQAEDEILAFQGVDEYMEYTGKKDFDVAFLDIELGNASGIQFALELKKVSPHCNIIFITSYAQYGAEAFKTRPSGYVLKPYTEEDIRLEMENLRYPVEREKAERKLKVVTFGNFVVYRDDGQLLTFTRTRSKEVFAYLIDCGGYPATTTEIAEDVFEEKMSRQVSKNLSKIIAGMLKDLEDAGYVDVVIKQNRQLAVNRSRVSCDIYDALSGDVAALNAYHGEYMIDYSWAELSGTAKRLEEMK